MFRPIARTTEANTSGVLISGLRQQIPRYLGLATTSDGLMLIAHLLQSRLNLFRRRKAASSQPILRLHTFNLHPAALAS
ncbi:MAG: hypothetical protein DVB33_08410 [Verrucomicrobia bacterium]|nr:MAG: hypothetical protein DVB33_08410 [Verrucomicrobiota bacterium]